MSERKEEEEMVDQGQSGNSESSESEHMVDAQVELLQEESPQQQQEEEGGMEEQHENPSGNSDDTLTGLEEGGDKNVVTAEVVEEDEAQLNGGGVSVSSPHKANTVEGMTSSTDDDVEGRDSDNSDHPMVDEGEGGDVSLVQTEVVSAEVSKGGALEVKEGDENVEEEPKNVEEEAMNVEEEELKDTEEELKDTEEEVKNEVVVETRTSVPQENGVKEENLVKQESLMIPYSVNTPGSNQLYPSSLHMGDGEESGTDEEQAVFTRELESFFRERSMEFKHPKFYGEGLNCLKLWRSVTRLGGYDRVTACKLWRQVGESFHPPKTCTTVSWSFRIFYEKSLLDYERHKMRGGELVIASPLPETLSVGNQMGGHQGSGSGRARRDAAARAMQGWHSQRLLGNGEVGDPIIKDKSSLSTPKREKHLKSVGLLKRKKTSSLDRSVKVARAITKVPRPQIDTDVVDAGPPADWVKINVRRTKDCFEVYALVPGLLREEVRVQSDPAGRLVISGDPEQPDNPWGVTPFRKVITLPSRIDPHQTSAVVTLHGQLFVRVPFEQSDL